MNKKDVAMLKVFTDFNARTRDGVCWNLVYNGIDLVDQIDKLNLKEGDEVILYQDDDDFEVMATLDFRWVDVLDRDTWVAVPNWDTMVRKELR